MYSANHQSRALSCGSRRRASSPGPPHDEFIRIIQEATKAPAPIDESDKQRVAAYRAEARSTLNHFQLSSIQIRLNDSQEADRQRDEQRTREHEMQMETLCRVEGQQVEIKTQLGEIHSAVTDLGEAVSEISKRLEQMERDELRRECEMRQRIEREGQLRRHQTKDMYDTVRMLVAQHGQLQTAVRRQESLVMENIQPKKGPEEVLGDSGGIPSPDTISRPRHKDTRLAESGAVKKLDQWRSPRPTKRKAILPPPSGTLDFAARAHVEIPQTPPRKKAIKTQDIRPAEAGKKPLKRTYARATKKLDD